MDECYMNLGGTAWQAIETYKHGCQLFNVNCTLLWHNNRMLNQKELYIATLNHSDNGFDARSSCSASKMLPFSMAK